VIWQWWALYNRLRQMTWTQNNGLTAMDGPGRECYCAMMPFLRASVSNSSRRLVLRSRGRHACYLIGEAIFALPDKISAKSYGNI
jgi:hypothetical protein